MRIKEADKIIKAGKPVTVLHIGTMEKFTKTFVRRDRWNLFSDDGGKFDRGELVLLNDSGKFSAN